MHPFCLDQGVGVLPWSPLARGTLTRAWGESTARTKTDKVMAPLYDSTKDADRRVVDAVGRVAEARGVSRAQVALAWVIQRPAVTSPIVGTTKPHHLEDALAALELTLTADELAALEEPYVPHTLAAL